MYMFMCFLINYFLQLFIFHEALHTNLSVKWKKLVWCQIAEFFVSICSIPKFICSSYDGVPRLFITENTSFKCNIYKNRMLWQQFSCCWKWMINNYRNTKYNFAGNLSSAIIPWWASEESTDRWAVRMGTA